MSNKKRLNLSAIICAIAFAPAALGAARTVACVPDAASSAPNTSALLRDMRLDAERVAQHAWQMHSFATNMEMPWESNAARLRRIKAEIDDMGKRLCRLQTDTAASPAQQQTIRRVAPLIQYMADNADDAINYLNAHQSGLWRPTYGRYTENMYKEAKAVARRIHS